MKKLLWIVGGLIGLLIVAAVAAPFFVDLNNYKAEIAQKAKEATGRDLAIDGDISLSILPTPGVGRMESDMSPSIARSRPVASLAFWAISAL